MLACLFCLCRERERERETLFPTCRLAFILALVGGSVTRRYLRNPSQRDVCETPKEREETSWNEVIHELLRAVGGRGGGGGGAGGARGGGGGTAQSESKETEMPLPSPPFFWRNCQSQRHKGKTEKNGKEQKWADRAGERKSRLL